MSLDAYCLDLLAASGATIGGGFLVTRRFALTAAHCLRDAREGAELTVRTGWDEVLPARVHQVVGSADVALIELLAPLPDGYEPPPTGWARTACAWFGRYRPSASDPHLRGTVTHHQVEYKCEGGDLIPALQLRTEVELGDYRGYSGGPVECEGGSGPGSVVTGILLEQYPDRENPDRNANVLFAAVLRHALLRFDAFTIAHLLPVLADAAPAAHTTPSPGPGATPAAHTAPSPGPARDDEATATFAVAAAVARADVLLDALRGWGQRGVLEPTEVEMLRVQVVRDVITG